MPRGVSATQWEDEGGNVQGAILGFQLQVEEWEGGGLVLEHTPNMCEALRSISDAVPLKEKIQGGLLKILFAYILWS